MYHFRKIGDDCFLFVGELCQIMTFDFGIDVKFDHFGVDEYEFQFGGMFLV